MSTIGYPTKAWRSTRALENVLPAFSITLLSLQEPAREGLKNHQLPRPIYRAHAQLAACSLVNNCPNI